MFLCSRRMKKNRNVSECNKKHKNLRHIKNALKRRYGSKNTQNKDKVNFFREIVVYLTYFFYDLKSFLRNNLFLEFDCVVNILTYRNEN